MRGHLAGFVTIGGLFAALSAHAEPVFAPPSGCTLNLTVQMHECQVANYYTCAGDPAGDQWVSLADGSGEYFLSRVDRETRWVESVSLSDGEIDTLDATGSIDNASFSDLLATGRDDYDFVTRSNMGTVRRFIGHDQLTGEAVTIDGVALERCAFEMRIEDGEGNYIGTRKGMQYISRTQRVFFADTEDYENAYGDSSSSAQGPVTFSFPGGKGFAATRPQYDCDMMMTQLGEGGR